MAAHDNARYSRERAVISEVLGSKLDAAGVQSALDLWDRKFAGQKSVPLIEFVNEIEAVQALEARERHELRAELLRVVPVQRARKRDAIAALHRGHAIHLGDRAVLAARLIPPRPGASGASWHPCAVHQG